jgi:threonine dehydrogenase-like Zn-dependent dehydrogenase
MKAGHIVAPRQLEIVDTEVPSLDDLPGEPILVRLHAGVLCASDFPRYTGGAFNVEFPRPVGDSLHECIGQVIESRSPRFQPGDMTLAIPPDQRGLSECFVTDAASAVSLPSPYVHSDEMILGQPLGTVIWAARKLPNLLDLDVAVIGQGPIGLMFTHLLANMGARRVIALDKIEHRLSIARQMKATHTVNVDQEDPLEAVQRYTDGHGADIVVEAVGHQVESLHLAVDLCRKHGTVLMFGVPDEEQYPMPVWKIMRQNIRFVASVHPDVQRDLPLALDMIRQGRINVTPLITHRFAFEDAQAAFNLAIDRVDDPIKVVLETEAGRAANG